MVRRLAIATAASIAAGVMLPAGAACAPPQSGPPDPEYKLMATQIMDADQRLTSYLEASTKYQVVPPPTGLDRGAVVGFVNQHVTPAQTVRRMRKLMRLACLYNARPCAAAFAAILRRAERDATDYARSAVAVAAIGWLGDADQWSEAQTYFHGMLRRMPDESLRDAFVEAAFFLGPAEGTAELRRWAEDRRAALQAQAAKASGGEAQRLELAVDEMEEFINLELAKLDKANEARERIAKTSDPAGRAVKLIAYYLLEANEATPRLAEWAAFAVVRVGEEEPAARDAIAAECLKAAQRYVKTDPARQAEFDLPRAAALRAALFFRGRPTQEDLTWLEAQPDAGTDLLALRPNWEY